MTTNVKRRHRKLNTQERIVVAHTIGGSTFFKVEKDKKSAIKFDTLNKEVKSEFTEDKNSICCRIL